MKKKCKTSELVQDHGLGWLWILRWVKEEIAAWRMGHRLQMRPTLTYFKEKRANIVGHSRGLILLGHGGGGDQKRINSPEISGPKREGS